jgi:hypothetical protein
MNKEEGNYYMINDEYSTTKIKSLEMDSASSYFYLIASSLKEDSAIHIIEVTSSDNMSNNVLTLLFDIILVDAVIFRHKGAFMLFGIGYEESLKLGKESVYFCQEIDIGPAKRGEFRPKLSLKSKKANFVGLEVMGDSVYVAACHEIYKYNLVDYRFEVFYELYKKKSSSEFLAIKADPKSKLFYVSQKNKILVLDDQLKNNITIEGAHDNHVNHIDVNINKHHQILSTANESFLKFWDIRNYSTPNLIVHDHHSLINGASFNPFYDQLVVYSMTNGSLVLYGANTISSSVLLKLKEDEPVPDNKRLKLYEAALDDYVSSICWSGQEAWNFGASSKNKCYFDLIPQKIKFETMF